MAALKDGGVTMKDIGVLAAGNLMAAAGGVGQQLQKQIGQTGIPVYNVANACATGATALRTAIMADQGRRDRHGPRGRGREAVRRRPARGRRAQGGLADVASRRAATARSLPVDGRIGTETMPGVFAQIGMEYGAQVRRHELRAVRADQREEPRALDAEPARGVPEAVHRSTRS